MGKRIGLFLLTNIAVMLTVSIIVSVLGLEPQITANGMNYSSVLIMCLLWGSVGSIISLSLSKFMAKKMMGLELQELDGPYSSIVRKVHMLARQAGISKVPEVAIYRSDEVNAFATGPSKNNSLVAVSTGLLDKMSDDEIEGVLAHEVAHIANGDMVTMALVQGVVNAFVMFFARIATMVIDNAMRSSDDEGNSRGGLGGFSYYIVYSIMNTVFGIMAAPVVAYFSRYREFKADAGGASLAGKEKMIAALEKLKGSTELIQEDKGSLQAFKISNKSSFMELFSTHPPLEKRIERLRLSY